MDEKIIDLEALGAFKEKIEENAAVKDLGEVAVFGSTYYVTIPVANNTTLNTLEPGIYKLSAPLPNQNYAICLLFVSLDWHPGAGISLTQTLMVQSVRGYGEGGFRVFFRSQYGQRTTISTAWQRANVVGLGNFSASVSNNTITITSFPTGAQGAYFGTLNSQYAFLLLSYSNRTPQFLLTNFGRKGGWYRENPSSPWKPWLATAEDLEAAEERITSLETRTNNLEDSEDFSSLEELEDYDNSYLKTRQLYTENKNLNLLTGLYDGNGWTNATMLVDEDDLTEMEITNTDKTKNVYSPWIKLDPNKIYCFSLRSNDPDLQGVDFLPGSVDMNEIDPNDDARYYCTFTGKTYCRLELSTNDYGQFRWFDPQLEEVDSLDETPSCFEMPDPNLINVVQNGEYGRVNVANLLNTSRNNRIHLEISQGYATTEPVLKNGEYQHEYIVCNHELSISLSNLRKDEVLCMAFENTFKKFDDDNFDRREKEFDDGKISYLQRYRHTKKAKVKKWLLMPFYMNSKLKMAYHEWEDENNKPFIEKNNYYSPTNTWKTYSDWFFSTIQQIVNKYKEMYYAPFNELLLASSYPKPIGDNQRAFRIFINNSKTSMGEHQSYQRVRVKFFIAKVSLDSDNLPSYIIDERESRIVGVYGHIINDGYDLSETKSLYHGSETLQSFYENFDGYKLVLRMEIKK